MRIQAWHIIVLILVIILIFGSAKLPELAKSIGQSLKIFKKEMKDLNDDGDNSPQPPAVS